MTEQLHTTVDVKKITGEQLCCRHTKLVADESMRMLKCELCGLWIDPFEYILKLAQNKAVLHWHIGELERKKKELYEQIEALKKEKRKARRNSR